MRTAVHPKGNQAMTIKTLILTSVAAAALIGASPAYAFTHHPGTPAEHQQTDDLNQQQLQQAQQPDAGTSSNQTTASNAQTSQPMQTANTASPSSDTSQPASSTTPVNALTNSPQTLANASVESSSGQAVGAVQRVITDAGGKAKTVVVALLGKASHMVAIAANELTFDQSRNVVVADLSADQINSLPTAPQG